MYECKNRCLQNINDCPSCSVAYEFIRNELLILQRETEDVLHGNVRDYFWTSPIGEVYLSLKLFRGVETLEQLNNEMQVTFLSGRRLGLIKCEFCLNGNIEHETWETLGVVEPELNKFNTQHKIPVTIYNNEFVRGFRFFTNNTIEWMHSEDYQFIKNDHWNPDKQTRNSSSTN